MITPDVAVYISIRIKFQFFVRLYHIDVYAVDNWFLAVEVTDFHYQWTDRTRCCCCFFWTVHNQRNFQLQHREFVICLTTQTDSFSYLVTFVNLQMSEDIFSTGGSM